MAGGWRQWAEEESRRIRQAGQWRAVRDLDGPGPETAVQEIGAGAAGGGGGGERDTGTAGAGRPVVSFASNDYLGLTRHPAVVAAARDALDRWGTGAGSARLVAGARPVHRRLEAELAAWKQTEAAVLFPTGFAANLGVLQVLGGFGVTIVSDELNHASIVDGCRLARGDVVVTPHADVDAVERAVTAAPGRALVVTESVFSMDGDVAPIDELVDLCARHRALLVVDEAHAVLGPEVAPPAEPSGLVRVGTLSKALASLGGFAAGPAALCDLLVNRARSFVFTTASTPADSAAALAALEVVCSAEGEALRRRLRGHVERLLPGHASPVIPVPVGDEAEAVDASSRLLQQGLLVPAIRPPTVPPGTARLRISLSAAHTIEQVERLAAALEGAGLRPQAGHTGRPALRPETGAGASTAADELARPELLVVVLGTATGVGKTWAAAALARSLTEQGISVAARKPVQSSEAGAGATDAEVLAAATGEAPADVCPRHRWYGVAMAPPLAARALGLGPFSLADLLGELRWPPGAMVGLVEGVGGPRSPLAADADSVALATALSPDHVVLVADSGLGAINAVLLAVNALPQAPVVLLNRFDPAHPVHAGNRAWLAGEAALDVVTTVDEVHQRLVLRAENALTGR